MKSTKQSSATPIPTPWEQLLKLLEFPPDEVHDILPLCRKCLDEFNPIMEEAIQWNLQADLFEGRYNPYGLRVMGWHEGDQMKNREYDFVRFTMSWGDNIPNGFELTRAIGLILLSDCMGCCDALEYINLSPYGIVAYGNISSTYHS